MQYFAPLRRLAPELQIDQQALLDARYLARRYSGKSVVAATLRCYAKRSAARTLRRPPDLWWLEKELWPYVPAALERLVLVRRPYVLDIDDAIFHSYDLHPDRTVRRLLGRKIDRLMAGAALVIAGNHYLAARARAAGAPRVEVLPTVIDLNRYPARSRVATDHPGALSIGWIGSPATVHYLRALAAPLARLGRKRPVRLVVVGGGAVELPGVEVVAVPWSADSEVTAIEGFDIGVMPLPDSPWERGKCGYKLVQYMACGIPVIASPVGVNVTLISEGVNGFLAGDADAWFEALAALAGDAALRERFGAAGRRRVEEGYCVQVTAPRLASYLLAAGAHEET